MVDFIILFIFAFTSLFLLREGFQFYKAIRTGEKNITTPRLFGIGAAISYIITILISGLL